MKRVNPYKILTCVLIAGIGVAVSGSFTDAEAKPPKEALMLLGVLEQAKSNIFHAPKDKDGHRQKAMEATKKTIEEVRFLAFGKEANKLPWPK